MKKVLALLMVAATALSGAAINRLYTPDFVICPGETMQVAIILDNDELFTAFQTDLVLPQGLSVVQDDGEYLLDLGQRNANDHSIISKLRPDSSVRMVSFSIGVKPYSGTTGALVAINLTADDDFVGPATIRLKNSICTTVDGVEFILQGESCDVQLLPQLLRGDVNGDGIVSIKDVTYLIDYLLAGCQSSFHTENADLNDDGNVTIADVTALIDLLLSN